ncbi:MAG: peroxiredoxin [Deltaproteobacteria bacterium]|nr:peroxiredoxin [Deltaproteobacteria bacterium]
MLAKGQQAPDFTLPDQDGNLQNLKTILTRGPAVVYFYPRDETAGCTAQACKFRDEYADFKDAGAEVFGVSDDSVEVHKAFAKNHRLPFRLLADVDNAVHRAYGVTPTLGLLRGRITYVIDQQGTIVLAFDSHIRATAHIGEALAALRALPK